MQFGSEGFRVESSMSRCFPAMLDAQWVGLGVFLVSFSS